MNEGVDLDYMGALVAEEHRFNPDPGGTAKHPTLRKGIVTTLSPFQVDGLPASNLTQQILVVGDVVWMLVDAGRRLVVSAPARIASVGATASRLIQRDANGRASVTDPSAASHIATKGYTDAGDSQLSVVSEAVQGGSTALTSTLQTLASLSLAIPSFWNTWRLSMCTTMAIVPNSPTANRNYEYQLRHATTVRAPGTRATVVFAGNPTSVAVNGGHTSALSNSGTQSFNVRGRLTINDTYTVNQCYLEVTAHRVT